MNASLVDRIAAAVLYEGYLLYPYRPSVKTRHRWTFGGLLPRGWCEAERAGDRWTMECECLVRGTDATLIEAAARFLHLVERTSAELVCPVDYGSQDEDSSEPAESTEQSAKPPDAWQEGMERRVELPAVTLAQLRAQPQRDEFFFPDARHEEPLVDADNNVAGIVVRDQQAIEGAIELSAEPVAAAAGTWKVRVSVTNLTPIPTGGVRLTRDEAMMRSLVSTHAILVARDGEFVSLTDPPDDLRQVAAACRNTGAWPVLVGSPDERDAILCSPIILPDCPQIAPESPGDLFDGTEIDEILSLRILTLTDEEKRTAASTDERARRILERTESLAREQLMGLHGTFRNPPGLGVQSPNASRSGLTSVHTDNGEVRVGDRVRLHPLGRADPFDMLLDGKTATVVAIEQDYEHQVLLAVAVDDDPGKDLAHEGKPGHRFFFRPEEVERLPAEMNGAIDGNAISSS